MLDCVLFLSSKFAWGFHKINIFAWTLDTFALPVWRKFELYLAPRLKNVIYKT